MVRYIINEKKIMRFLWRRLIFPGLALQRTRNIWNQPMNKFRDLDLEGLFIFVKQNTTGKGCIVIRNVFILSYDSEDWGAEDQKPTSREVVLFLNGGMVKG